MNRLIAHLRANLVGWVALFVALGGTGYAAINIPRNSVGAAQIRNRSISPVKFNPSSIGGNVHGWAINPRQRDRARQRPHAHRQRR
jgi:hypothetical protein